MNKALCTLTAALALGVSGCAGTNSAGDPALSSQQQTAITLIALDIYDLSQQEALPAEFERLLGHVNALVQVSALSVDVKVNLARIVSIAREAMAQNEPFKDIVKATVSAIRKELDKQLEADLNQIEARPQ